MKRPEFSALVDIDWEARCEDLMQLLEARHQENCDLRVQLINAQNKVGELQRESSLTGRFHREALVSVLGNQNCELDVKLASLLAFIRIASIEDVPIVQ